MIVFGVLTFFVEFGLSPDAERNQLEIELNRPPAQVFPWLVEGSKLKQWVTGLTAVTQLTPGPEQIGTKMRYTVVDNGQKANIDLTITGFEPNKLSAYAWKQMRS